MENAALKEPSPEEFTAEVVRRLSLSVNEPDVPEFAAEEEQRELLQYIYRYAIAQLRCGEITEKYLMGSCVRGAVVCLELAYGWEHSPDKRPDEPSFDEFRYHAVYDGTKEMIGDIRDYRSYVSPFLHSVDPEREMHECYDRSLKLFRDGKISKEEFLTESAGNAAIVMFDMYMLEAGKEDRYREEYKAEVVKRLAPIMDRGGRKVLEYIETEQGSRILDLECSNGMYDMVNGKATKAEVMSSYADNSAFALEMICGLTEFTNVVSKNSEEIPTYLEFLAGVEKYLIAMLRASATPDDVREYITAGEGDDEVKERYCRYLREFLDGKLTRLIFLGDCTVSVGYCLELMY